MIRTHRTERARQSPGSTATAGLQPGAVYPLRPMAQDELFSGAVRVIRRNPRAVLGLPLIAGLVNFAAAILLVLLFPSRQFLQMFMEPTAIDDTEVAWAAMGDGGLWLLLLLTSLFSNLLLAVSVGLLAIPTLRAAYGLPTTLGQTVRLRAGTLGWLVLYLVLMPVLIAGLGIVVVVVAGLTLAVTLLIGAVVVLPGLFLLLCWTTVAVMFGPLTIVVERRNAFSALRRSIGLNRGLWWRHIGTVAMVYVIGGIAMLITSIPAALVMGLGTEIAWQSPEGDRDWLAVAMLSIGQLYDAVIAALLTALAGTLIGVMYLNSRFRQEALDATLLDAVDSTEETPDLIPGSSDHLAAAYGRQTVQRRY